ALIKARVRRQKLEDTETPEERISNASLAILVLHLQTITQHSKNQLNNCLNRASI
ncbi:hypothetical protein BDF14DRAFT_1738118, partial [Spinellus fusiger]